MSRTVSEQVRTGLRFGGGLGIFLIGGIILGQARARAEILANHNQTAWFDWVIWLEVLVALSLLFSTVQIWYQLLGGCLVFGIIKGLIAFVTGNDIFPINQVPGTHIASIMVLAYCTATLLLLSRFMRSQLTLFDRAAITFYLFCLIVSSAAFPSVWEIAGLAGLVMAWGFYLWRRNSSEMAESSRELR